MIHSKLKTTRKGQDRVDALMAALKAHPNAHVTIGVHGDAGKYQGKNAPDVFEVALWNEYGTRNSPARPFVGPAVDENEALINRWREEAISNIITKGWSIEKCLEMMGFRIKTLIENKIKSNVPPPNAPSTVAGKQADGLLPKAVHIKDDAGKKHRYSGSDAIGILRVRGKTSTLRNTDTMLRSVTYKVHL